MHLLRPLQVLAEVLAQMQLAHPQVTQFQQIVVEQLVFVLQPVQFLAELRWAVEALLELVQFAQTAVVVPGLEQLDLKMKFLFRGFCIYIRLSLHPHLQIDQ